MKELIILKLGGSVITDKYSKTPKINLENLKSISKEIASVYDSQKMSLILVHGAGSYGHNIVKETGIDKGIKTEKQLKDFAETQRLQNELNCIVAKQLIEQDLAAIPYQASTSAIMESGKLIDMPLFVIKGFLEMNLIPVLYGVPAYDKFQKCSILSGDQIVSYLATKLNANKIIHVTNLDGVFTSNPHKNSNAKLISEINSKNINQIKDGLKGSIATDVTGGMFGKVSELIGIGIDSQIINISPSGNITKAIKGEKIGTVIKGKV